MWTLNLPEIFECAHSKFTVKWSDQATYTHVHLQCKLVLGSLRLIPIMLWWSSQLLKHNKSTKKFDTGACINALSQCKCLLLRALNTKAKLNECRGYSWDSSCRIWLQWFYKYSIHVELPLLSYIRNMHGKVGCPVTDNRGDKKLNLVCILVLQPYLIRVTQRNKSLQASWFSMYIRANSSSW